MGSPGRTQPLPGRSLGLLPASQCGVSPLFEQRVESQPCSQRVEDRRQGRVHLVREGGFSTGPMELPGACSSTLPSPGLQKAPAKKVGQVCTVLQKVCLLPRQ